MVDCVTVSTRRTTSSWAFCQCPVSCRSERVSWVSFQFSSSLCIPYSSVEHIVYSSAFIRLLSEDYKRSADCYRDANLIQEKCTKLRECCPNFDGCVCMQTPHFFLLFLLGFFYATWSLTALKNRKLRRKLCTTKKEIHSFNFISFFIFILFLPQFMTWPPLPKMLQVIKPIFALAWTTFPEIHPALHLHTLVELER